MNLGQQCHVFVFTYLGVINNASYTVGWVDEINKTVNKNIFQIYVYVTKQKMHAKPTYWCIVQITYDSRTSLTTFLEILVKWLHSMTTTSQHLCRSHWNLSCLLVDLTDLITFLNFFLLGLQDLVFLDTWCTLWKFPLLQHWGQKTCKTYTKNCKEVSLQILNKYTMSKTISTFTNIHCHHIQESTLQLCSTMTKVN